jgi:hypothetical protein
MSHPRPHPTQAAWPTGGGVHPPPPPPPLTQLPRGGTAIPPGAAEDAPAASSRASPGQRQVQAGEGGAWGGGGAAAGRGAWEGRGRWEEGPSREAGVLAAQRVAVGGGESWSGWWGWGRGHAETAD